MHTQRPVLILSFTLMVVMLGYGMVLPVLPFLIERLGAGGRELGWLMAAYALAQLLCAPLWGVLSDRVGRKPVLALGVLGYAVSLLMFGLATSFWMLLVARALSGILSSATMPTAMAFVGDAVPEEERAGAMGLLGAAAGVGVVAGPLLGGLLAAGGLALPFFVGAGVAGLALLLVLGSLPESHPLRSAEAEAAPGPEEHRWAGLGPAGLLLLLIFLTSFGLSDFQGIMGLYVMERFGVTAGQVGMIWVVMGGTLIVVQGGLLKPLTKAVGETPLILAGFVCGALGLLGMTLAADYRATLLAVGLFALALALLGPALNAALSRLGDTRQGALMGLNGAAGSLGKVLGPLWAGYLYEAHHDYPYLTGAAAFLIGLGLWAVGTLRARKVRPTPTPGGPHPLR